ncbi:telomerase inhibitor [Elasticomyces elasticus]|nr:telomerase inhibitor [Elasticomyces elasticus]
MGLGAPKNRVKLSRDPNNTAWSNSTEGYGHRILSSQGWKTGDYLGAENAAHADTYTAANASHVRVALREDNLGLGAKVGGKSNAETFGLSTLSSIFGRLNGKSDEDLEKQQKNLRDAELRTYQAQKHGFMNFVRGGLLVGDKIEEFPVIKKVETSAVEKQMAKSDKDVKTSKKRKAGEDDPGSEISDQQMEKKRKSVVGDNDDTSVGLNVAGEAKKRKERPSDAADTSIEVAETAEDVEKAAKRQRKEQRRLERASRGEETTRDEKARLKQEKRARKEDRRKRKEEKLRAKAGSEGSSDSEPTTTTTTVVTTAVPTPATSEAASGASTPVQAAPMFSGGRHAIRQRYIMQKRMASMDPRALNEILMIKAQV